MGCVSTVSPLAMLKDSMTGRLHDGSSFHMGWSQNWDTTMYGHRNREDDCKLINHQFFGYLIETNAHVLLLRKTYLNNVPVFIGHITIVKKF